MSERENNDNSIGSGSDSASGDASASFGDASGITIRDGRTRQRSRRTVSESGTGGSESSTGGSVSGHSSVSSTVSSAAEQSGGSESRSSSVSGSGSSGSGSGSDGAAAGRDSVNSSGSGHDASSASGEVKKRRRRKRDAEGNFIPLDESDDRPTTVSLSRLGAGDDVGSFDKGLVEDALGFVADGLFDLVPRFFVPKQAHHIWPLDDDEKSALVKRGKALVNRMSKRNKTELMKRLDKWMPPIMLGATAIALVHPRIQATQLLVEELRRQHAANTTTQATNGNGPISTATVTTPPENLGAVGPRNESNGRARANPLDSAETL